MITREQQANIDNIMNNITDAESLDMVRDALEFQAGYHKMISFKTASIVFTNYLKYLDPDKKARFDKVLDLIFNEEEQAKLMVLINEALKEGAKE